MEYKLLLTAEATREVRRIVNWYLKQSSSHKVAQQWLSGLDGLFSELCLTPHGNSLAREDEKFEFDLFERFYGSGKRKTHRIIYRIHDDQVVILAVRHHAQKDLSHGEIE